MQIHSLPIFTGLVTFYNLLSWVRLNAQIIPDNSLGNESSVVVPNVNIKGINSDRIDGGAIRGSNLFHSFQEFNIDNGGGAYFSNPENTVNILTRVTHLTARDLMAKAAYEGDRLSSKDIVLCSIVTTF